MKIPPNTKIYRKSPWVIIPLFILATSSLSCSLINLINCHEEIIHPRQQSLEAMSLLEMEIPADVDLSAWEWKVRRGSPADKNGANIFVHRFGSVDEASNSFEYECKNGWYWNNWDEYYQSDFMYNGKGDKRFCASPGIEWRYDATSLCDPSGEYESYVVFQKKDIVIAIYENTSSETEIGKSTNRVIRELADKLQ